MHHRTISIRVLAAVAAAVGLAMAVGTPSMSAQTPGAEVSTCSPSATPIQPPAPPSDTQLQQWQTQFAQGISQSLNVPLATVQQDLSGLASSVTAQQPVSVQDPLATAASQLNVSLTTLLSAVQSADQTLLCAQGLPSSGSGNAVFFTAGGGGPQLVDPGTFYTAVAQNLGQGLTGQQVQAAFAASAPSLPDPSKLITDLQNQFNQFATSLGVSTDALKTALQSIGASGGCLPPNTFGGFRVVTKRAGGPPPPSIGDLGPIIIPFAGGTPPRLPGNPGDPLGLGLAPCGISARPDA